MDYVKHRNIFKFRVHLVFDGNSIVVRKSYNVYVKHFASTSKLIIISIMFCHKL